MPYHLVCRDCHTERVYDDPAPALRTRVLHAAVREHTVVVTEVEPANA